MRMSMAELWDYTKKVLVDNGQDPPKMEETRKLLNLSERTQRNVLWDVIILSPRDVNSFIDNLITEELEHAKQTIKRSKTKQTKQTNRQSFC